MEKLYPYDLKTLTSEGLGEALGETYATDISVMIEAKDKGDGSRRTLLTLEMF